MFSHETVNWSGKYLSSSTASSEQQDEAVRVLNDWRALHLVPLNTFQATLRKYVKKTAGKSGIVAQRLKRVPTIIDKLNRYPQMQLSRMQDIGGLRAIVTDIAQVRSIEKMYQKSRTKHQLKKQNDYITEPKESGYRGIHIIYRYCSPDKQDYDGLFVEIQLRTHLQHLWATAVETVDFFFQESVKYSRGNTDWQDFFKLVSAVFALEENEKPFADFQAFSKQELIEKIIQFDKDNRIFSQLETIKAAEWAKRHPQLSTAKYWVIETILNGHSVIKIHQFLESQQESADLIYRQLEQTPECKSGKKQVVLMSVDSVSKMEKAYPNFFGNIKEFLAVVKKIIAQKAIARWKDTKNLKPNPTV